jgi:hypothetical protein
MANAPGTEVQRLDAIAAAMQQSQDMADQMLVEASLTLQSLQAYKLELEASLAKSIEGYRAAGLTDEEILHRTEAVRNDLVAVGDNIEAWSGAVREFSNRSSSAAAELATNRQARQMFAPTLFGSQYTRMKLDRAGKPIMQKKLGPDGKPMTDEAGNPIYEAQKEVVKIYGQLDKISWSNLAGKVNDFAYSMNKLGDNITNTLVSAIDAFVTTAADLIMGGADKIARQQQQAEIDRLRADSLYNDAQAQADLYAYDTSVNK